MLTIAKTLPLLFGFSLIASAQPESGRAVMDGSNVRVTRHKDGTRTVLKRSPDDRTLVKQRFSPAGSLILRTLFRTDERGNPLSGKIHDHTGALLFKTRYGYDKASGRLESEEMFDVRDPFIDPKTGREMPVQTTRYLYDEQGNPGKSITSTHRLAKTAGEIFQKPQWETDPFQKKGEGK